MKSPEQQPTQEHQEQEENIKEEMISHYSDILNNQESQKKPGKIDMFLLQDIEISKKRLENTKEGKFFSIVKVSGRVKSSNCEELKSERDILRKKIEKAKSKKEDTSLEEGEYNQCERFIKYMEQFKPIPESEPEKSPADVGLDIVASKKFVENLGSEKEEEEEPMTEEEVARYEAEKRLEVKPIIIDIVAEQVKKSAAKKESEKKSEDETLKPDIGKITEETESEVLKELAKEERVKVVKKELIDLAKNIEEARKNKEIKTEESLCNKAEEFFEVATGDNLKEKARAKAKVEAEIEGFKIVTPEEYRKIKTLSTQERIRQTERSAVINERWDIITDKEKAKYFDEGKDKNDPANINLAITEFAKELNEKIDAKRQELSNGKNGITISEDVFYELMKKGLKAEDIKKRGFFGRMFGDEIEIPSSKTDKRGSLGMTREGLVAMEITAKKNIENRAQEEIERKILEGQKMWRGRKQRHTGEIIQETAVKYEAEKKLEEEKRASKITENLRLFDTTKDFEKLMKKVDFDIKARIEQKKKIQELEKKIKKGKPLTKTEIAFLNRIDPGYRKEAEK